MDDSQRLRELEVRVERLARETASLRAALRTQRMGAAIGGEPPAEPQLAQSELFPGSETREPVPAAAAPRAHAMAQPSRPPRPHVTHVRTDSSPVPAVDIEALVGRYGTIALATVSILAAVGAFLAWAISAGLIGPTMRVVFGAMAAAAMAATGWWVREHRSKRFGNILLALGLAIVHVDAWGAGPLLHVLPDLVALLIADAASVALAWFAITRDEETLFAVGLGGALLAPFVTSSETGSLVVLVGYGLVALMAGMWVLNERAWRVVRLLAAFSILVYAAVAITPRPAPGDWLTIGAPAAFALGTWIAGHVLLAGANRTVLIPLSLFVAAGAMVLRIPVLGDTPWLAVVLALATTVVSILTTFVVETEPEIRWLSAILVPVAMFLVAVAASWVPYGWTGGILGVAWAVPSAIAVTRSDSEIREFHAFTATLLCGAAVLLAAGGGANSAAALGVFVAAAALTMRRLSSPGIMLAALATLLVGAVMVFALLYARDPFVHAPFLTMVSLAAVLVSAGAVTYSLYAPAIAESSGLPVWVAPALRIPGVAMPFLWIRAELVQSVSVDVATFLLIAYYATVGLAGISFGKRRGMPEVRRAGLVLSVYASLKAILSASGLAIGWRVGGYLFAGLFLLGAAYWYRRSDDEVVATA